MSELYETYNLPDTFAMTMVFGIEGLIIKNPGAIVWPVLLTMVFLPLSVPRCRRLRR